MYNPALGTFINLDPLESGSNLYAYCGDAPTDGTDPSGTLLVLPFLFQKFSAEVTDSAGNTLKYTSPSDLYDALKAIDRAGNRLTSMTIWGHSCSRGVVNDTGAGPERLFSVDKFFDIFVNGHRVSKLLTRITDQNTTIDLRGCFNSTFARRTAKSLHNGTTVRGTLGPSFTTGANWSWLGGAHALRVGYWTYSFPSGSDNEINNESFGADEAGP